LTKKRDYEEGEKSVRGDVLQLQVSSVETLDVVETRQRNEPRVRYALDTLLGVGVQAQF